MAKTVAAGDGMPLYECIFDERGSRASVHAPHSAFEVEFTVNDWGVSDRLGCVMAPAEADLIDVAVALYAADRVSPRSGRVPASGRRWARRMVVEIPVRLPHQWLGVRELLQNGLFALTEDVWELQFTRRAAGQRPSELQGSLLTDLPPQPRAVALFSVGLDSLAGTWITLSQDPRKSLILVSGATHGLMQRVQENLAQSIARAFDNVLRTPVVFHLGPRSMQVPEERTQRARGLLFLLLAGAVAGLSEADTVDVYENGVGAFNLPYTETSVGARNTRAMWPTTLAVAEQVVQAILGQTVRFRNPFLFETKGSMCRKLARTEGRLSVGRTFSCDGFPQRRAGTPQCGVCTSCILRRQALWVGGLDRLDSRYVHDLLDPALVLPEERWWHLEAMVTQVRRFECCLQSSDPWDALCDGFPALVLATGGADEVMGAEVRGGLLQLLSNYVQEWHSLPISFHRDWLRQDRLCGRARTAERPYRVPAVPGLFGRN